ncbi:dynein regulatory complex protein 8 [Cololabis saira]|uniref:dynein regulatory complex protein 8 n=1 Tax=Cololabis saira TaxID=129043 RepID=UPI002AD52FEC|nr:dynein regulatory complex protein 8 [Cololabis saira]
MAEARESDVKKKIKKAFQVFEFEGKVDVREIGSIVSTLGCFPTEAQLHNFIAQVEEDETKYVHFDKFLPAMTEVLLEKKFPPISDELLIQAFEVLDIEKKNYLDYDQLVQYMTTEGEPFTQEEMKEMLEAHGDPEKKVFYCKDMISKLTFDPDTR